MIPLQAASGAASLQGAQEIAAADARLMETGDISSWEWDMQQLISSEAQARAVSHQAQPCLGISTFALVIAITILIHHMHVLVQYCCLSAVTRVCKPQASI